MKSDSYLCRAGIALSLLSCIGLTGCASALHAVVSPAFSSAIESAGESMAFNNATPATYGISPDLYRGFNCQQLAVFKASSEKERSKPGADRMLVQLYGFEIDAYAQVEREKGCLTTAPSGSKAAPVVAATAGDIKGQLANGSKVSTGRIGITIADVQAHIAEGSGLDRPRGALVISVVDGGPAKQAGLKPLDIILSVNGRVIERSSELQANLHSGTEATLQVWRDRAARPLKVKVVAIPGPGPGEGVVAQSMPSPPAARVTDAPPRPYCFATLEDLGKVSGVMSGVWERPTSFNTRGGFAAGVDRFVRVMRQLQPGVWNDDFAAAKCWENVDTMCDTNSLRHLFGSSQVAIMLCEPTRDQALAVQKSLRQAKQPLVYQPVDYSAGSID